VLLRLDSPFAEVILRVLENGNVAIMFKKGTISYQSVNQGQKTFNPASIAASGTEVTTVTVPGALVADKAAYAFFTQDTLGVAISAVVSAPDTVTVTFTNPTSAAVDVPSGVLYALSIA
jgi:succinyl-CoA synthetase alpha subunit